MPGVKERLRTSEGIVCKDTIAVPLGSFTVYAKGSVDTQEGSLMAKDATGPIEHETPTTHDQDREIGVAVIVIGLNEQPP